jgi:hypothetical protein
MRKFTFAGVTVLLLGVLVWAGGDPWKNKPFEQWTDSDIAAVLQSSPWAKVNLQTGLGSRMLDSTPLTQPVGGVAGGGGGGSNTSRGSAGADSKTSAGSLPGQPGGLEKNADAGPGVYNAFWYSSRTIREALARRAVLHSGMDSGAAAKFVEQAQEEYTVMVQGPDMSLFQQRGEKAFDDAAYLELKKSKQKIAPSHVEFQRAADGTTVLGAKFFFSKKGASGEPAIGADEKQVDFYLRVGSSTIRTYFEPRKMVDAKGLDL